MDGETAIVNIAHNAAAETLIALEKSIKCEEIIESIEPDVNFISIQDATTEEELTTEHHVVENDSIEIQKLNGIFKCPSCEFSTRSFGEFITHFTEHRQQNPLLCFVCGLNCEDPQDFIDHSQSHIKALFYKCPKCNFQTGELSSIENHMQTGHESKLKTNSKNQCPICNMFFDNQSRLKVHLNVCGLEFSSEKSKDKNEIDLTKDMKHEIKLEEDASTSIFTCPVCFFIFSTKLKLSEHISLVHSKNKGQKKVVEVEMEGSESEGPPPAEEEMDPHMNPSVKLERIYLCPICHYVFTSVSSLNKHIVTHKNVTECPVCKFECETNSDLKEHLATHSLGEGEHFCSVCDETFSSLADLKNHIKKHHSKNFRCPYCPRIIKTENALRLHIEAHSKLKGYHCPKCKFNAKNFSLLQVHMSKFHRPKKRFSCEYCFKSYKFKFSLQRHVENCIGKNSSDLKRVMDSEKRDGAEDPQIEIDVSQKSPTSFNCSECNASFSEAVALKKHLLVHFRVLPFRCIKCGYRCKLKHQLSDHLKTHKIDANYECRLCKKKFKHKHALNNHFITHTDERPFTCEICGLTFKRKSNYRRHYDGHSDVRPFECSKCDFKCRRNDGLLRHIQQHHCEEDPEDLPLLQ